MGSSPPRARSRLPRRGAEAVEFALVMPVLISILIGMIEMSWLFYTRASLDSSTSVGCRAGALVDPGIREANLSEVQDAANTALISAMSELGLRECDTRCSSQVSLSGSTPSRTLICSVTYDFQPLIGLVLPQTDLVANQVVRMEWQRQ